MRLRVLLFASYAEAIGAPAVDVDLPEGGGVADLLAAVRTLAAPTPLPPAMVAVNQVYARATDLLRPGDEIAIIPPVAGG